MSEKIEINANLNTDSELNYTSNTTDAGTILNQKNQPLSAES